MNNMPYNDNDDQLMQNATSSMTRYGMKAAAQVGKRVGKYAAKAVFQLLKLVISMLLPYLIPIIIALLVFFIIYSYMFLLPKYITSDIGGVEKTGFTSIFGHSKFGNGWSSADEKALYKKYVKLCDSWSNGLDSYQREQVSKYKVSWALLASIDRISSDYSVSGKWGRNPQPEANYEALKPSFEWDKYEAKHIKTYEYLEIEYERDENGKLVRDENGDKIVASEEWVDKESDESEEIKLIQSADTFDNLFEYEYEEFVIRIDQYQFNVTNSTTGKEVYRKYRNQDKPVPDEYKEYDRLMKSSKDTDRRRDIEYYITKKEVSNITSARMPLERLYSLLLSYGIAEELEVESVIHLAETYDENFYLADFVIGDGLYEYGVYVPSGRNIWNTIPTIDAESLEREDIVDIAESLLTCVDGGPLPYFWGGKYPKMGMNARWGQLVPISAAGNSRWRIGTRLPYGLDCSGFVDWVYVQATGKSISALVGGGGAAAQYYASKPISKNELRPGDLGFLKNPYQTGGIAAHVGIYIGDDKDGTSLFIHSGGTSYSTGDPFYRAGRVLISRLSGSYHGNPPVGFKYFGRPPVKFTDD